jgi:hypothetical protein
MLNVVKMVAEKRKKGAMALSITTLILTTLRITFKISSADMLCRVFLIVRLVVVILDVAA